MYTLQSYQDGVCKIGENKIIHPLAYILHTHALGQVGTVYVQGALDWDQIRKGPLVVKKSFHHTLHHL